MNAEQKRNLQSWLAICLVMVCVAMPLLSNVDRMAYEDPGWDTPEEAVLVYLEGLKEQNIEKMISAYAVETCVDHFDLKAQLARLRAYTVSMIPRVPNSGDLLRGINIEARKNEIVQSILLQMTSICLPGQDFSQTIPFTGDDGDKAVAAFVDGIESAFGAVDFSALKFLGFMPPEQLSELYASERNQENIRAQIAPYGAEEARSVIALFMINDKFCALTCDVMRYGDQWFMYKPGGNIASLMGLSVLSGGVISVPQEELVAMREGLGAPAQKLLDDLLSGLF